MDLKRAAVIPLRPNGRVKLKLRANHRDPRRPIGKRKPKPKKS